MFDNSKGYVLINGASSGIGKALTLNLLKRKIKVIAVSRAINKLAKLKKTYKYIETFSADLSEETDRIKLYEWVKVSNLKILSVVNSIGSVAT